MIILLLMQKKFRLTFLNLLKSMRRLFFVNVCRRNQKKKNVMTNSTILNKQDLNRPNFHADDFFKSNTAEKHKIINYPSQEDEQYILQNLISTADMMQELRDLLGKPIYINSAYRCLELNRMIGSKDTSQHLKGLACDWVCPDFDQPKNIVRYLKINGFNCDQCLNEGAWIHISRNVGKENNRQEFANYVLNEDGNRIKILL